MFHLKSRFLNFRFCCALALMLAGCATSRLHQEGMDLMAQGRYPEAIAKLDQAASQAPDDTELHKDVVRARELASEGLIAAGNAERVAGHFDRADAAYKQALALKPESGRAVSGLEAVAADRRHAAILDEATKLVAKNDLDTIRNG